MNESEFPEPSAKLLIVDGHALFYRAFHAFPQLTAPSGEIIGAVYGFTRILLSAIDTIQPTHAIVAFDLAEATFRHHQYEEYKAHRAKAPEELTSQLPRLRQVVETLEIPIYTSSGYEADDVIGTLARQAALLPGFKVTILSGDQDLLQLVDDRISVYAPGHQTKQPAIYTPVTVEAKYGFPPKAIVDYKALRGDPSDNIPGVPGIGEITAAKLIQQFGSVHTLYEKLESAADTIKPGILKTLRDNKAAAELSLVLATIDTDAPVEFEENRCRLTLDHPEAVIHLFQELGFKSLINELPKTHRLLTQANDVFGEPDQASESEHIDAELAPVLREMETCGVMVDLPYLKTLEQEYDQEIVGFKQELFTLAGEEFNPDSPSQVGRILYETLNIPTTNIRKGKTGYTTDAATLQELAKEYPIAALLLKYREVMKLQSTYVRPLQQLADDEHRVHTSYAPDTSTGRISSKNPNLQNIPARSEQGRRIRKAFVASPGTVLLSADYSQMELRIAAHLADDPVMKELFKNGGDFHAQTAERMGVDRYVAKMINFSILYGKSAYTLSQDLDIPVAEAKKYIETYFKTYRGLRAYLDRILDEARRTGYTETMFGRRRYFPDLLSSQFQRRGAAEREAVNLPIQGSQAEILKRAMISLHRQLKNIESHARLLLTVHDELVLELPPHELETAARLVHAVMVNTTPLTVPTEVNVYSGSNWAEVEPFTV